MAAEKIRGLAGIDQRSGRKVAQQPQAFEICPQDRILDPKQLEPGVVHRLGLDQSLFGVDHHKRVGPDRTTQQVQAVHVPSKIRIAKLDFESVLADAIGMAKKFREIIVAEVVGAHLGAFGTRQRAKRQLLLLGGKIPKRNLKRLVERQAEGALVAAARPGDTLHQRQWDLALKSGPDFGFKGTRDLGQAGQGREQALRNAQPVAPMRVNQLDGGQIGLIGAQLAGFDHTVAGNLNARDLER
ncbi:MAG: hypothetical protein ABIQ85_04855 [Cypionkella sp.]